MKTRAHLEPTKILFQAILLTLLALLLTLPEVVLVAGDPVRTDRDPVRQLETPDADSAWSFAIMGDRTGGPAEGIKVLARAVKDVNLIDPDLTMTVGDLIQGYNGRVEWLIQAKQFKDTMDRLRRPWYPVAGNHDIYWRGEDRPVGEHESDYEQHFGPLWYWFDHKNCGFIVLYSDEGDPVTGEKNFGKNECQKFSPRQLAWLEEVLTSTEKFEQVFVFVHHPRWRKEKYNGSNWQEVHKRLARPGNVAAVFGGHHHQLHFDGVKDGIEYHTLAATGAHLRQEYPGAGWVHHWNLVTVRPQGFEMGVVPVGSILDPKQYTTKRHILASRLLSADLASFRGEIPAPAQSVKSMMTTLELKNPVDTVLRFKLRNPDGALKVGTAEVVLLPGSTRQVEVQLLLDRLSFDADAPLPHLEVVLHFDDEQGQPVAVPTRTVTIRLEESSWRERSSQDGSSQSK